MRLLWLPHLDWAKVRNGQREHHLAEFIKDDHTVHILTWERAEMHPRSLLRSLRSQSWQENGLTIHQSRRVPNPLRGHIFRSGRGLWINEQLYGRAIRQLVRHERIDLVLCGINHEAVGLPPADLPVPLIFDYLDFDMEAYPELEAAYMQRAEAVICTSKVLLERSQRFHPYCYYLPNGADAQAMKHADGDRVRRSYGLQDAKVVSLIGITASERLFYVDALAAVARDIPNLVFLIVGPRDGLVRKMVSRARELGLTTVTTGLIPRSEVADFFAATDVGLYPGDQTAFFDAACPLKVLEYTLAGKPVVATELAELRNWAFPNVHLAPASADAFAQAVKLALNTQHQFPDMTEFNWEVLGRRFAAILDEVAERGKWREGGRTSLTVQAPHPAGTSVGPPGS